MGVTVEPLTAEDTAEAARLHSETRRSGLSLADHCCLAPALRLGVPALTADKAWQALDLPVEVELIR